MSKATPIYGFMHVALMPGWRAIVLEQLSKLRSSGLYEKSDRVRVGVVGDNVHEFDIADPKLEIGTTHPDLQIGELPTLDFLSSFCQSHDCLSYYIHTKGVSRGCQYTRNWRHLMEYFLIERHDDCLRALRENDICGVNWKEEPLPHFSGNFWWAKSEYIQALPAISEMLDACTRSGNPNSMIAPWRGCEFWIGSGAHPRVAVLHDSRLDHYHHLYPRWRYEIEGRDSAPESRIDGLRSLDPESWCIRDDSTDHGAIGKRDKIVQEPPTASNLTTSTVKASAHTDPLKPYHQACELAEQKNYGRVRILISEFASHTSMILDAGDCTNPQADKSMKDSEGTAASQRSSDAWDLADSSSLWQAGNLSIAHMPGTSMISVNGVRGFLTRGDVSFLCDLAGELPDGGRYLEVGSWLGLSSILIATQLIANRNFDAKVFCVDTWEGSPEHQGEEEITERTLYDEFRRNVLSAGVGRVISPVRMPSVQAEKHWNQGPLDVVFIDGDHSAKSCLSDIEAWLPRLKSGGRMLGHDAVPGGSVEEALKTFRNRNGVDYKIHEAPDTHFIWELVLGDSHATGTSEVGVGLHGP